MKIYFIHISQFLEKHEIAQQVEAFPKSEQDRILSFHHQKDQNASFYGRVLLQYVLNQHGLDWSWDEITYTTKGRPSFPELKMDFNLSHSGMYVALVVGQGRVGIDIEKHRHVNYGIFNRQFFSEEWEVINQSEDSLKQFFDYWAIKESAIKADGRGVEVLSKTKIISDKEIKVDKETWFYSPIHLFEDYSISVSSNYSFIVNKEMIETFLSEELLNLM